MAKSVKNKEIELSYSDAIKEVEEIIASFSTDSVEIDTLPDRVKRAMELIEYCRKRLTDCQERVTKNLNIENVDA